MEVVTLTGNRLGVASTSEEQGAALKDRRREAQGPLQTVVSLEQVCLGAQSQKLDWSETVPERKSIGGKGIVTGMNEPLQNRWFFKDSRQVPPAEPIGKNRRITIKVGKNFYQLQEVLKEPLKCLIIIKERSHARV